MLKMHITKMELTGSSGRVMQGDGAKALAQERRWGDASEMLGILDIPKHHTGPRSSPQHCAAKQ